MRRAAVVVALVATLLSAISVTGVAGAQTPPGRSVTVDPADSLVDGQFVSVTWSGFTTSQAIHILPCRLAPTAATDCAYDAGVHLFSPSPSGQRLFRVTADAEVIGFRCDVDNPCSVGVFDGGDSKDTIKTSDAVFVKTTFSPTAANCPSSIDRLVRGAGDFATGGAFLSYAARLCRASSPLDLDYTPISSPEGRGLYLAGSVDFAVTAGPISEEEAAQAGSSARPTTYAPVAVTGLTFIYNMQDRNTNAPITDLKLTPNALARIFTSQVTSWRFDPEITALNPGRNLPQFVRSSLRADRSADTLLLTSWLKAAAPEVYASEATSPIYKGPPGEIYPPAESGATTPSPVQLFSGADPVGRYVVSSGLNREEYVLPGGTGYIAAVDSSLAARLALPVVRIVQPLGNGRVDEVAPTPEALRAAVADMTLSLDGTRSVELSPEAGVYPLPKVSHLALPLTGVDPATTAELRQLVDYAVGPGQATDAGDRILPRGYLPLPAELVTEARQASGRIGTGATAPAAPPSTTPAPAPPPLPTLGGGSGSANLPPLSGGFETAPVFDPLPVDGDLVGTFDDVPLAVPPPIAVALPDVTAEPSSVPVADEGEPATDDEGGEGDGEDAALSDESRTVAVQPVAATGGVLARSASRLLVPAVAVVGVLGLGAGPLLAVGGPRKLRSGWRRPRGPRPPRARLTVPKLARRRPLTPTGQP